MTLFVINRLNEQWQWILQGKRQYRKNLIVSLKNREILIDEVLFLWGGFFSDFFIFIIFMFKFIFFRCFSIRLFLREFCIEMLRSAYNNLVRQVRRLLERNANGGSSGHDDSYLLWAIRFFMEFNRLSGFQLDLVR